MLLAEEEIYAVAGAAYVAAHGLPGTVEELCAHRLIHLEEPFRETPDWNDWFASAHAASRPESRGLLINDYALVMQAAMEGQGVALGWRHLTERLITAGLLVRVTGHALITGKGFYVIWQKGRDLTGPARQVRDWLVERA
jgi:DNA-binding transcriptional LysR family regulator